MHLHVKGRQQRGDRGMVAHKQAEIDELSWAKDGVSADEGGLIHFVIFPDLSSEIDDYRIIFIEPISWAFELDNVYYVLRNAELYRHWFMCGPFELIVHFARCREKSDLAYARGETSFLSKVMAQA